MNINELENLEYAGGGYFREKSTKPIGVARPIIHAPILFKEYQKLLRKVTEYMQHGSSDGVIARQPLREQIKELIK